MRVQKLLVSSIGAGVRSHRRSKTPIGFVFGLMLGVLCFASAPSVEAQLPDPDALGGIREHADEGSGGQFERRVPVVKGGGGRVEMRINEVRMRDGKAEMGPPLRVAGGLFKGSGVITDAAQVGTLFAWIDGLPVSEQVRLAWNRYAGVRLEVDLDGDGIVDPAFLTIEFPGRRYVRERVDPLTGLAETLLYEDGLWLGSVTEERIVEIAVNGELLLEEASRTYANTGTREEPVRSPEPIEETRTVEVWHRDWSAPEADPTLPVLAKIRVNYVTGRTTREVFAMYPRPVEVTDARFITRFGYNAYGIPVSAEVRENGRTVADRARPVLECLGAPVEGEPRFEMTVKPEVPDFAALAAGSYRIVFEHRDVVRKGTRFVENDLAKGGRVAREWHEVTLGGRLIRFESAHAYDETFHHGLIPLTTEIHAVGSDVVLERLETESYDVLNQRLVARSTDYRGGEVVKSWVPEWESPVSIVTPGRLTDITFSAYGLAFEATTTSAETGEEIVTSTGTFDPESGFWTVTRRVWSAPGILQREEILRLAADSRLVSLRTASGLEAAVEYAADGRESARNFSLGDGVVRIEDDYVYDAGTVGARVRTFVAGKPYDTFRTVIDAEGRLVEDGVRILESPALELKTSLSYDGASERVVRAEMFQNGMLREGQVAGKPEPRDNGEWRLPVVVTPTWGAASTAYFTLGSGSSFPVETSTPGGGRTVIVESFPGTGVAGKIRREDGEGRVIEEIERVPSDDGSDMVAHYRVGEGGKRGLAATRSVVRGTDITLFRDKGRARRFFDISKPYEAPDFEIDTAGERGARLMLGGKPWDHVMTLFRSRMDAGGERLRVDSVELGGLFSRRVGEATYDPEGRITEEISRRVRGNASDVGEVDVLIEKARALPPVTRHVYQYGGKGDTPEGIEVNDGEGNPVRRFGEARVVPVNPYLPDTGEVWTVREMIRFGENGDVLFTADVFEDSAGRLATVVARKRNAKGQAASRISYELGPPSAGGWIAENAVDLRGAVDFSDCHFVALHVRAASMDGIELVIADGSGKAVTVSADEDADLDFWPTNSSEVQWIPEVDDARQAASVAVEGVGTLVVSVPGLRAAGLDVGNLTAMRVRGDGELSHGGMIRLGAGEPVGQLRTPVDYGHSRLTHESGIASLSRDSETEEEADAKGHDPGSYWSADLGFHALPIGKVRPRRERSEYPIVILEDHSIPSAPIPLYALVAETGEFIEHYRTLDRGDSLVYTIAPGFRPARLEVSRAGVLEDESSPGLLAFGENYAINLPLSRTGKFHNQVASSIFKVAGDSAARALGLGDGRTRVTSPLSAGELHLAAEQARAIEALPSLAESVLPHRPLPWEGETPGVKERVGTLFEAAMVARGLRAGTGEDSFATPLLPTASGTEFEDFVDTVEEMVLVRLAVRLGEMQRAASILDFYWDETMGGTKPAHTSYDRRTGASLEVVPRFERPSTSPRTAGAQIAIAGAALDFAEATGDFRSWQFATLLADMVWAHYRQATPASGISEEFAGEPVRRSGVMLWPAAEQFLLETNASALVLVHRIDQLSARFGAISENAGRLSRQSEWLRRNFLEVVERTGIVPNALFRIQDLQSETEALGLSKWTSASAWLAFLDAADRMGVPREQTRRWLENLARVHGVRHEGIWGLDWSLALVRPDALSPGLTATFFAMATRLEHAEAAAFARAQLAALLERSPGGVPAKVLTTYAPTHRLPTGQGESIYPRSEVSGWPRTLESFVAMGDAERAWPEAVAGTGTGILAAVPADEPDLGAVVRGSTYFYLSILFVAVFWWTLRALRHRRQKKPSNPLVTEAVLRAAEERWAKRVMGMCVPEGCGRTRFAHGPVEANFLIQLRAIYKLVVEWRRLDLGWEVDDPRIVESDTDAWLNGVDEFAMVVALYMRFVIKSGRKDGGEGESGFDGDEDSNYVWARLVFYFSEYYLGFLTLIERYHKAETQHEISETNQQIFLLLNGLGMRNRKEGYDARVLLDYPRNPDAFDLMVVQREGATLPAVIAEATAKLGIPERQFARFLRNYKAFKKREDPAPVHPLIFEAAKVMPHFILMTLIGVVWYNTGIGGLPIIPYLREATLRLVEPASLVWAIPLVVGYGLNVAAFYMRSFRFEAGMRKSTDAPSRLHPFRRLIKEAVLPLVREGRGWNPSSYARVASLLRGFGFAVVGAELLFLPAPSFAVFLILKGLLAAILLAEAAAIILPLGGTWLSMAIQRYISGHPNPGGLMRFLHSLNITATRPASIVWLSVAYHYPVSVTSGGTSALVRSVVSYFGFAAMFLFAGSYVLKEVLGIWFVDAYQMGWNVRMLIGGILFFNTMYLMRFGLSVLMTAIFAALVTHPLRVAAGLGAMGFLFAAAVTPGLAGGLAAYPSQIGVVLGLSLALVCFEERILATLRCCPPFSALRRKAEAEKLRKVDEYRHDPSRSLAVVYMSGDDLGHAKLTQELLMERWRILRDQLGSSGARLQGIFPTGGSDLEISRAFQDLYGAEERAGVTLWHPMQLVVSGAMPVLPVGDELNIEVADVGERERLLGIWHLRRWIVSMMSTAGHSQDTAVNLIDIALRLAQEQLSERVVFYLIQNKYDDRTDNRPGQVAYGQGELAQREKLARLLMAVAPGSRAYNLNDWTPFGFKAGGMMAMDLVYEESLRLTNMLVLDRNATVHDLDALMEDIFGVLADPGVVNVIPGRSTTNTLTPIGQGSQSMEEGHRQLLKGIMLLGGEAGEAVGTGWGNIQAIYYGRVQRAMLDARARQMPLTTRMMRGSTYADRLEGMIGFGPHAVGISEDIWAVVQGAHNAIALGLRVKFVRSKALWHKIRETWSHADWFSAFPRWSGGYLQMMQDPLMQRINDCGPLSLFAKESRANNGRFYLTAPFSLLSILVMPLAILWDASPFVQILIILWNFGFILNQVLTSLGLMACLEATGFSKTTGLLGGLAAGGVAWAVPLAWPVAAAVVVLGFLAGGFLIGFGRWLLDRGRDIILFGPQLVIHALGQVFRQSLEFVLSGAASHDARAVNIAFRAWAGPREDRPWGGYGNPVNLRTVVWVVGLLSVAFNLFALTRLDFQNVVLLLPSLLFGVSCLLGPFLQRPKPGESLRGLSWIPKSLGWIGGFTFYTVVATLVAASGWMERLALGMLALCLVWVAAKGLRYVGFRRRLSRARARLEREIVASGAALETGAAARLAHQAIVRGVTDLPTVQEPLLAAGLSPAAARSVAERVRERVHPLLKSVTDSHAETRGWRGRFACEFRRSFALSLATFIWFVVVPVPGLLLFTAGDYRIGIGLTPFVRTVVAVIAFTLVIAALGRIAEHFTRTGILGRRGLVARLEETYRQFREAGHLGPARTSAVFALFTDAQTYFDQRSYGYVRRTLDAIDGVLRKAVSSRKSAPAP